MLWFRFIVCFRCFIGFVTGVSVWFHIFVHAVISEFGVLGFCDDACSWVSVLQNDYVHVFHNSCSWWLILWFHPHVWWVVFMTWLNIPYLLLCFMMCHVIMFHMLAGMLSFRDSFHDVLSSRVLLFCVVMCSPDMIHVWFDGWYLYTIFRFLFGIEYVLNVISWCI